MIPTYTLHVCLQVRGKCYCSVCARCTNYVCMCSCYMCSRTDKIFSSLSRNSHTHWFGFSRNCSFRLTDLRATYLLTTFMQFLSCCLLHVNDFDSVTFFAIIQAWITSIDDTVCFFALSY